MEKIRTVSMKARLVGFDFGGKNLEMMRADAC